MVRQDIFTTLSDNLGGKRCTTTSQKGKVRCTSMEINTDKAGTGDISACFDKEKDNVDVVMIIPEDWEVHTVRK